jgi:uracil phosphoribosyltransferase
MNAKAPQPNSGRKPAPPSPPPPKKRDTEDLIEIRVTNEFILTKEQYAEMMKKIDGKQPCVCAPVIISGETLRKAVQRMKNKTGGGKP